METELWCQWNIYRWLIAPMEKAWFYEGFFFEVVMVMLKDKNIIKDTMSIQISFMYYMKWIKVLLLVVFVKFELVCILLLFFSFRYHFQLVKDQL